MEEVVITRKVSEERRVGEDHRKKAKAHFCRVRKRGKRTNNTREGWEIKD